MSEIKLGSYVISNNDLGYKDVHSMTPYDFIEAAKKGIEIEGDLFFYIPDFSQGQFNLLSGAITDVVWFCFDKNDIPHWVNANIISIFKNPRGEEQKQVNPFLTGQPTVTNQQAAQAPVPNTNFSPQQQMMSQQPMQTAPQPMMQMNQTIDPFANAQVNSDVSLDIDDEKMTNDILDLLESDQVETDTGDREAVINLFGSSKGGTGKTFTCIISAYRYAKQHPGKKVCLFDADITDPQVAIAIHKVNPTLYNYWRNWSNGNKDFAFMEVCKTQNSKFPSNLDFYLAPKDYVINNDNFWLDVLNNLIQNYDVVFIDSGIDYINIPLISYCYKIADRIVLVSTTSIKSTSSVMKQINRLKGNIDSVNSNGKNVYSKEDEIGPKLRLAITGYDSSDKQNSVIIETFQKQIKIGAIFGMLNSTISKAEFYGKWDIFDDNKKFNEHLDRLIDPSK